MVQDLLNNKRPTIYYNLETIPLMENDYYKLKNEIYEKTKTAKTENELYELESLLKRFNVVDWLYNNYIRSHLDNNKIKFVDTNKLKSQKETDETKAFKLKQDSFIENILRHKHLFDKSFNAKDLYKMPKNEIMKMLDVIKNSRASIDHKKALEAIKYEFENWADSKSKSNNSYDTATYIFHKYMQDVYFYRALKGSEYKNERIALLKSLLPKNMPKKIFNYFTGDNKFTNEVTQTDDGYQVLDEIIDGLQ